MYSYLRQQSDLQFFHTGCRTTSLINFVVLDLKGCKWNLSSPDYSVIESDVIEIQCVVIFASGRWTPVIQCLPETPAELVSNNVFGRLYYVRATVMYRKMVTVTSRLNNVNFNCHVSTTNISSIMRNNAHDDIHLWTSPALRVIGLRMFLLDPSRLVGDMSR